MKPIVIKVEGSYYLNWDEQLLKILIVTDKYKNRYYGANLLIEFEDKFSYQSFKNLNGIDLPEDLCITSHLEIELYEHVYTLQIARTGNEVFYQLTNNYDLDKWKEDYHLEKFCACLWESFSVAGFETYDKPQLEEFCYFINVSITESAEIKIQDVVEGICKKLKEIHDSSLEKIQNLNTSKQLQVIEPIKHKSTNSEEKLKIFDGLEITKYKGKFFEIDIPKIVKNIFKSKNA